MFVCPQEYLGSTISMLAAARVVAVVHMHVAVKSLRPVYLGPLRRRTLPGLQTHQPCSRAPEQSGVQWRTTGVCDSCSADWATLSSALGLLEVGRMQRRVYIACTASYLADLRVSWQLTGL